MDLGSTFSPSPSADALNGGRPNGEPPPLSPTSTHTTPREGPASGPRLRDTDQEFAEFVRAQVRRVPMYARQLNVPDHEMDDIVQQTLIKLHENRAVVDRACWGRWLQVAIGFRTLLYVRRIRQRLARAPRLTCFLSQQQRATSKAASPEEQLVQHESARELDTLLDKLTPERREVVFLYLVEDMAMKDVAEKLEISVNTAKTRWRLGCKDMEQEWKRQREQERTTLTLSAFLAGLAAFFVAFWRRLTRDGSPDGGISDGSGTNRRRPKIALLACAALPIVAPSDVASTASPSPEDTDSAALAAYSATVVRPYLTTNAERERDSQPLSPRPFREQRASEPVDDDRMESARAHLLNARRALMVENNPAKARTILELYELTYPDDPIPAHHAELSAALQ